MLLVLTNFVLAVPSPGNEGDDVPLLLRARFCCFGFACVLDCGFEPFWLSVIFSLVRLVFGRVFVFALFELSSFALVCDWSRDLSSLV